MTVSIVMPVYNEVGTIEKAIQQVMGETFIQGKELIVVDDGSTDGTRALLEKLRLPLKDTKILLHDRNRGKGSALRTGFQHAAGDIIVIQDADLEYDPRDYPRLLEPLLDGRADVVYGSRFLGGPHRVFFFWHYVGNRFLTLLSNALNDLNLTDMETCYKAFKRQVIEAIPLRSNRFGFEPEFTAKVAKRRFRIYEVPIGYSGREYSEGKKATWKDGVAAVLAILWYRFFD